MYVCMYVCMCVYIYIYIIYIQAGGGVEYLPPTRRGGAEGQAGAGQGPGDYTSGFRV